jgi:hypothetical protein
VAKTALDLDPASPSVSHNLAVQFYLARQFDQAIEPVQFATHQTLLLCRREPSLLLHRFPPIFGLLTNFAGFTSRRYTPVWKEATLLIATSDATQAMHRDLLARSEYEARYGQVTLAGTSLPETSFGSPICSGIFSCRFFALLR